MALERLAADGVLERRPRVGTFIKKVPDMKRNTRSLTRACVILPNLPDSYLRKVLEGVESVARSTGVDLLLRRATPVEAC